MSRERCAQPLIALRGSQQNGRIEISPRECPPLISLKRGRGQGEKRSPAEWADRDFLLENARHRPPRAGRGWQVQKRSLAE
eukprot:7823296-Alexandrium_andersonii.AAC.1